MAGTGKRKKILQTLRDILDGISVNGSSFVARNAYATPDQGNIIQVLADPETVQVDFAGTGKERFLRVSLIVFLGRLTPDDDINSIADEQTVASALALDAEDVIDAIVVKLTSAAFVARFGCEGEIDASITNIGPIVTEALAEESSAYISISVEFQYFEA